MYCGHYFHPQAMDLHVAECYRVFKANQEIAKKNMEHQVKVNKSQQEAVKFAERKRNFEEGLAKDIMNQFMEEVSKQNGMYSPPKEHPRGAWGKKMGSLPILSEENLATNEKTDQNSEDLKVIEKDLQANVQGKWKQRLQKSPTLEVKATHSIGTELRPIENIQEGSIGNVNDEDNRQQNDKLSQQKPITVPNLHVKKTTSLQEARLNKWKGNQVAKPRVQEDKIKNAMSSALAIGGNHKEMLRNACKEMEGDMRDQAEVFFFEKIGAALLNNFKQNLKPCRYCSRKFYVNALKKHEPICARTSPLPKKKF